MKVMLLYPKWTGVYGIFAHFAKRASTWPPLNLGYLAAVAEKKGHEVKIIDGQVENISLPKIIQETPSFKPDIIGITATTPFYHLAIELAKELKQLDGKTPIVIGGPHITLVGEEAFSPLFDYAFIGESDESWPMFLERYQNGKDISSVKGILFRDGDNVKFTGMPEPIGNIDSIPFSRKAFIKDG